MQNGDERPDSEGWGGTPPVSPATSGSLYDSPEQTFHKTFESKAHDQPVKNSIFTIIFNDQAGRKAVDSCNQVNGLISVEYETKGPLLIGLGPWNMTSNNSIKTGAKVFQLHKDEDGCIGAAEQGGVSLGDRLAVVNGHLCEDSPFEEIIKWLRSDDLQWPLKLGFRASESKAGTAQSVQPARINVGESTKQPSAHRRQSWTEAAASAIGKAGDSVKYAQEAAVANLTQKAKILTTGASGVRREEREGGGSPNIEGGASAETSAETSALHQSGLKIASGLSSLKTSFLSSIPSINISSPSSVGGGAGWEPPTIAGMPPSVASSSSASSGADVGKLTQLDLHSQLFAAAQCGDFKTIQAIISEQVKQC
jgi:hypothetical protein